MRVFLPLNVNLLSKCSSSLQVMATLEVSGTLGTGEAFLRRHCRDGRGRHRLRLSVHFGSVAGEDVGAAEELITEGALVPLRLVGGQVPPEATAVLE